MALKGIGRRGLQVGACLVAFAVLFVNSLLVWESWRTWAGVFIALLTFAAIGWLYQRRRAAAEVGGTNVGASDGRNGGLDRSEV